MIVGVDSNCPKWLGFNVEGSKRCQDSKWFRFMLNSLGFTLVRFQQYIWKLQARFTAYSTSINAVIAVIFVSWGNRVKLLLSS
jgi:hypothetical protein